jgi:hypothetical protein
MRSKSRKKLVLAGAARFNSKPKLGLAFLEENKLIYSDLSPEVSRARSLAIFLKSCTRLEKRLLGDYLSKPENLDLLKEFMDLFDFKDVGCFVSVARTIIDSHHIDRGQWWMPCGRCLRRSGFLVRLNK